MKLKEVKPRTTLYGVGSKYEYATGTLLPAVVLDNAYWHIIRTKAAKLYDGTLKPLTDEYVKGRKAVDPFGHYYDRPYVFKCGVPVLKAITYKGQEAVLNERTMWSIDWVFHEDIRASWDDIKDQYEARRLAEEAARIAREAEQARKTATIDSVKLMLAQVGAPLTLSYYGDLRLSYGDGSLTWFQGFLQEFVNGPLLLKRQQNFIDANRDIWDFLMDKDNEDIRGDIITYIREGIRDIEYEDED